MPSTAKRPVLVLNASYEPINVCAVKRAVGLLLAGTALVEEAHKQLLANNFPLPAVIRLKEYRKVPHRDMKVSRKHILIRDRHTCQYCGIKFKTDELTLDHIIPRAQGGKSRWENLVAACGPCNRRKADRTPEQAAMPLLNRPRNLTALTSRAMLRMAGMEDPMWRRYVFVNEVEHENVVRAA